MRVAVGVLGAPATECVGAPRRPQSLILKPHDIFNEEINDRVVNLGYKEDIIRGRSPRRQFLRGGGPPRRLVGMGGP